MRFAQAMPQAALGTLNIRTPDVDLSNFAADWMEDEDLYVGSRACSMIGTESINYSYPIWDRQRMIEQRAQIMGPDGAAATAAPNLERKPGRCQVWGLEERVSDFTTAQASGTAVMPERHATKEVAAGLLRRREDNWNTVAMNANAWNGVANGAAANTVANFDPFDAANRGIAKLTHASSNPVVDGLEIRKGMLKRVGYAPNVVVLGAAVLPKLIANAEVRDYIQGGATPGNPGIVTLQGIAAMWRLDAAYVMEGISEQSTFFNENDALFLYVDRNPQPDGVTSVACIGWDTYRSGAMTSMDIRYDNDRLATVVRGIEAYNFHIVSKDLGVFVNGWV